MRRYTYCLPLLLLVAYGCQKSASIAQANDILNLAVDSNGKSAPNGSFQADNYTYAQIIATTKDSSVVDTTTTIAFTTDYGTFSTGGQSATVKIDLHGRASVFLKSKTVTTANVQATIGGNYSQNIQVAFTTSYPDSLFINLPDSAVNLPETQVNFNTVLYKRLGSPSAGFNVNYGAFDTAGNKIGAFYNETPSDSTGKATCQFWLNNGNYIGLVRIRATIAIAPADTVSNINVLYFVK